MADDRRIQNDPGRGVGAQTQSDTRAQSKAAGIVILAALAAVAVGFVIFATLYIALLIGLATLLIGIPLVVYRFNRWRSSDPPARR
jgi:uncharacterized membrane protein HdeD (DUF308 family)